MSQQPKVSKKQLLKVIDELERSPHDRVRILGEVGISTLGIGLGAAAAGTMASIAGAISIPILTTAAGWVGVTAVAATPLGWALGAAAAGGVLALRSLALDSRRCDVRGSQAGVVADLSRAFG